MGLLVPAGYLPIKKQLLFFQQWSSLYKAGIPITQGMDYMREQLRDRRLNQILDRLDETIERGEKLGEAFQSMSGQFPPLLISLIEQGEEAGKLESVLDNIVELLEKRRKRLMEIQKSLAYPIFLGVLAILLLPIPDAYKEGLGRYIRDVAYPLGAVIIGWYVVQFIRILFQKVDVLGQILDAVMIRLPFVGNLVKQIIVARFALAFSALLETGIQVGRSLEIAGRASENKSFEAGLAPALAAIEEGKSLSEAFGRCPVIPRSFSMMLATAEKAGETTEQLARLARLYDSEADAAIAMIVKLVGPMVLIVIMGGIAVKIIGFYMKQFNQLDTLYRSL